MCSIYISNNVNALLLSRPTGPCKIPTTFPTVC
uniref:Uncharacterized protein n=1 Tax=Anguilla anguilla TaxID=7936 RepID=A0A0E9Q6X9_ANGAN